jgi:phosphomannomutase
MSDDVRGVLDRIVKAYDVRGLVDEIPLAVVRALGVAAARELVGPSGRCVVGRDMRPSSPGWVDALADGLMSEGVEVVDLGLASTDQVYFASGELDAAAAMVTASHNPASYNGIKWCRPGAVPVAIDSGLATLRDLALSQFAAGVAGADASLPGSSSDAEVSAPRSGSAGTAAAPAGEPRVGTRRYLDLLPRFAEHVRSFVDADRLREVSVAVDAGNGMAGLIWPEVVAGLPVVTEPLYFDLDGTFPNHPADPLDPANLVDLAAAVTAGGHALGFAFDGDADRVFAVDERGRPVSSSLIGAVVAERLLMRDPGATVLHNLICSRAVPETIRAAGGVPVRTRVGHSFIKRRMAETGAIFAAEHSGHYYFRDNYRADSGAIAALLLLEAVADADAPLSVVLAPYDRYVSSGELNLEVADPAGVLRRVEDVFAPRADEFDHEDGLTISLGTAWFNLRPSNTEPVLRLNAEAAAQPDLDGLVAEVLTVARATPG